MYEYKNIYTNKWQNVHETVEQISLKKPESYQQSTVQMFKEVLEMFW